MVRAGRARGPRALLAALAALALLAGDGVAVRAQITEPGICPFSTPLADWDERQVRPERLVGRLTGRRSPTLTLTVHAPCLCRSLSRSRGTRSRPWRYPASTTPTPGPDARAGTWRRQETVRASTPALPTELGRVREACLPAPVGLRPQAANAGDALFAPLAQGWRRRGPRLRPIHHVRAPPPLQPDVPRPRRAGQLALRGHEAGRYGLH